MKLLRKIEAWYWERRGIDHSGYMMLMTFRITQSYMKKEMDAMFIYAKIHQALDRFYDKKTIDLLCTATYQASKAGVSEKNLIKFLQERSR